MEDKQLLLEKLLKYSGCDLKTCEEQLAKRNGNFWEALYGLTMPVEEKDIFTKKLYVAEDTTELLAILRSLKEIYGGWGFSDLKSKVYDDDEAFFMSCKPTGEEGMYEIVPQPEEIEKYGALLKSAEQEVVIETLQVLGMIEVKHFSSDIISEIKKLLTGKNAHLANEAMRSNTTDQPEKIAVFLDELQHNFKPNRSQNHFMVIRAFWSKNAPIYPEITDDIQRLTRSGNSQVRDMANDVLVRYGQISPEEKAAAELRRRNAEVAGIHLKVEKIKTAKALYTFADKFNWDEDVEYMFAVIRHELCETATAKLVYWRSEPNYYRKFTDENQVEEYHRDTYRLQREIEHGISAGKYTVGKLKYDPKDDHALDRTESNMSESEIKKAIPEFMY
ncbi:hypothetical protein HYN59_16680 [Flavobacterium album]|uniref:DUF4274 domain-containing protein n=1 Tax=Flavobacterium album TaxID=2175091 RepID=A0A2S1R290_9FLAO|nr:DUF4274 domain-containing protein [Flavobacterium album]AWH86641.1 hypothetical protein HYN59_16680 [Flavobacterium album]